MKKTVLYFVLSIIDLIVSSVVSFGVILSAIGLIPILWIFALLTYDAILAIRDGRKSFKKLRR
jgi:hypothetical protein